MPPRTSRSYFIDIILNTYLTKNIYDMNKIKWISIFFLPLLIAGCSNDDADNFGKETPFKRIELNAQTRGAVDANNNFAFDLFKQTSENENSAVSPFSTFSVLSMMANGDTEATRDHILKGLGYENGIVGLNELNQFCELMNRELPTLDGRVTVSFANSIWTDMELDEDFHHTLTDTFKGEWVAEKPSGDTGMIKVNQWINDKTKGMIHDFLKSPVNHEISLINALYFNGKWTHKFEKANSKSDIFKNLNGTDATTKFMNQTNDYTAYFGNDMEMVELTYGSGNYSMVLVKPAEGKSFDELKELLDASILTNLTNTEKYNMQISLPAFKIESYYNLVPVLRKIGFENLEKWNFNAITKVKAPFSITEILHSVVLDVNEEGSEAAAATMTGIVISPGSIPHAPMVFNSPFIYLIRERSTNTIFFIGQVVNF